MRCECASHVCGTFVPRASMSVPLSRLPRESARAVWFCGYVQWPRSDALRRPARADSDARRTGACIPGRESAPYVSTRAAVRGMQFVSALLKSISGIVRLTVARETLRLGQPSAWTTTTRAPESPRRGNARRPGFMHAPSCRDASRPCVVMLRVRVETSVETAIGFGRDGARAWSTVQTRCGASGPLAGTPRGSASAGLQHARYCGHMGRHRQNAA